MTLNFVCRRSLEYLQQKHSNIKDEVFLVSYLPTPPFGQDMTQGQFLSGV